MIRKLFAAIMLVVAASCAYKRVTRPEPRSTPAAVPEVEFVAAQAAKPEPVARGDFRCDGRVYCSQMSSCEEARYFLRHAAA